MVCNNVKDGNHTKLFFNTKTGYGIRYTAKLIKRKAEWSKIINLN